MRPLPRRRSDGVPRHREFRASLATASGQRTKGEHAGHSQTSLWRNWRQTDTSQLAQLNARTLPNGIPLRASAPLATRHSSLATERVALVLPTSLCSSQIARLAAERLNEKQLGRAQGITRFVGSPTPRAAASAVRPCTSCCIGPTAATSRIRTSPPHFCSSTAAKKITNDMMRRQLENNQVPLDRFGWASVQLDGGIEKALAKIEAWFVERFAALPPAAGSDLPNSTPPVTLGFVTATVATDASAAAFAATANEVLRSGGSVLIPESDPLLANPAFRSAVLGDIPLRASLAYGEPLLNPGLHLVATESDHWTENLTGLGASGVHLFLTLVADHARPGHPMLSVLQVAESSQRGHLPADDIDFFLNGDAATDTRALIEAVTSTATARQVPRSSAQGYTDFQLTRASLAFRLRK